VIIVRSFADKPSTKGIDVDIRCSAPADEIVFTVKSYNTAGIWCQRKA